MEERPIQEQVSDFATPMGHRKADAPPGPGRKTDTPTPIPPAQAQAERRGPPPLPAAHGWPRPAMRTPEPKLPPWDDPDLLGVPVAISDTMLILVLTMMADLSLYMAPGGLGAACVLTSALGTLVVTQKKPAGRASGTLGCLVLLISAMMVWRHWWLLHVMGAISIFTMAARLQRPDWRLPATLVAAAETLLRGPARLYGHVVARRFRAPDRNQDESVWARRRPARVVLIPLAVCALFIMIFRAANPVVAMLLSTTLKSIAEWFEHFGEYVTWNRIMLWVLWLTVFAALIRPVTKSLIADRLGKLDEGLAPDDDAPTEDAGSYAAAWWTLLWINVVFLAYNAMDGVYLYVKAKLPAGITWADYTHAGCGWLTFGLFVSSVVIGITFRRRLNFHPKARPLKILAFAWAAQNGILAVSTMRRLQMYVDFSGLTLLPSTRRSRF